MLKLLTLVAIAVATSGCTITFHMKGDTDTYVVDSIEASLYQMENEYEDKENWTKIN